MEFKDIKDRDFVMNVVIPATEPFHSSLWSEVYDYVVYKYSTLNYKEKGDYIRKLVKYREEQDGLKL